MPWGDGVHCPRCGGSLTQTAGPLCCPACGYPHPPTKVWRCQDCTFVGPERQAYDEHLAEFPRHTIIDPA